MSRSIENMQPVDIRERILKDPASSYWLQNALRGLEKRDPVDALRDVEALRHYLKAVLNEVLE